jgi:hypothetical protein
MSLQFAVVHEAGADFQIATQLADRVLCDSIPWLDEDLLPDQRTWIAEAPDGERLTWTRIKKSAPDEGFRVHGRFDEGEPALPDARAARRAIRYLRRKLPRLDAIVLIRDQDDKPQRRDGLEQARREDRSKLPIVVGFAVVERECWILSGYEPEDDDETARLRAESSRLGLDPRHRNHDLTPGKDEEPRGPKCVLRTLSTGDPDRERRCWRETPLKTLRERGIENGLAAYLDEVQSRLAPLMGHTGAVNPPPVP